MRGYFYKIDNGMVYSKCHNCGHGASFGNVLKELDPTVYKEYCLEKFADSFRGYGDAPKWAPSAVIGLQMDTNYLSLCKRLIDNIMAQVDTFCYDHECVKYVAKPVPKALGIVSTTLTTSKMAIQLNEKYSNSIITSEPRLTLPFFNKFGKLTGVTRGKKIANLLDI